MDDESKSVGRPRIEFSPDQQKEIVDLASIGATNEEIAELMDCSHDTLTRNFAYLLKKGRAEMKKSLRRMMFEKANTGNPTMIIWLSKNILGYKDKIETSEEKEPLPFND